MTAQGLSTQRRWGVEKQTGKKAGSYFEDIRVPDRREIGYDDRERNVTEVNG